MKSSLLFLALLCTTLLVKAQQTFTETMGTQLSGSQSTIPAYEATNGFDQDWLTYSGNGNVTNSFGTPSSGYPGASGGSWAEIMAITGEQNFIITGLTPTDACANATTSVSFGAFLGDFSGSTSNSSLFNVSYSSDGGGSWTSAGIQTITSTWTLKNVIIPGNSNAIKFSVTVSGFYTTPIIFEFDDVTISNQAGGCALPVQLRSFVGEDTQTGIRLNWTTGMERNNSHFIVERGADAKTFEAIGRVEGRGTSDDVYTYTYLDESALRSVNYYRLKQVDLDGTFTYSAIVAARYYGLGVFKIYPNPTASLVTIQLPKDAETELVELYNVSGQRLSSWSSSESVTLVDVPRGRYLLRVRTTDGRLYSQWVVKAE